MENKNKKSNELQEELELISRIDTYDPERRATKSVELLIRRLETIDDIIK